MRGELLLENLQFGALGFARKHRAECEGDPIRGTRAAFGHHALGEWPRGFHVLHVVHQLQRLERRVAALAHDANLLAIGRVEIAHERRRRRAFEECVEAAAVECCTGILFVEARVRAGEPTGSQMFGG
jgi:hypothetical protein